MSKYIITNIYKAGGFLCTIDINQLSIHSGYEDDISICFF